MQSIKRKQLGKSRRNVSPKIGRHSDSRSRRDRPYLEISRGRTWAARVTPDVTERQQSIARTALNRLGIPSVAPRRNFVPNSARTRRRTTERSWEVSLAGPRSWQFASPTRKLAQTRNSDCLVSYRKPTSCWPNRGVPGTLADGVEGVCAASDSDCVSRPFRDGSRIYPSLGETRYVERLAQRNPRTRWSNQLNRDTRRLRSNVSNLAMVPVRRSRISPGFPFRRSVGTRWANDD